MRGLAAWYSNLAPRDRRALLLGLCVLGPVLLWAAILRPWWDGLSSIREAVAAESGLLERERELLADAPRLPGRMEDTRLEAQRMEARLLSSHVTALAEAELAGLLEDLARESRVLVLDLTPARGTVGEPGDEGPIPVRMRLLAESDFGGLLTLVEAIETDPLLMRVEAMTMQAGEDPGVMRMEAIIEAFAPVQP